MAWLFYDLYDKDNSPQFDKQFEKGVSSKGAPLYIHGTAIGKVQFDTCVSVKFIERAIKFVKRNSAPGDDQVTYEHILYGEPLVHKVSHFLIV